MKKTIFGIFNKPDEAQNAVKHLLDEGFTPNEIDVHRTREGVKTPDSEKEKKSRSNERNSDGYMNFLSSFFAEDTSEAENGSQTGRRGSMVTVHTTSQDESDKVAQVLDRFGAVDVKNES